LPKGWNTNYKAGHWLCGLEEKRTIALPTEGFDMYPQWSPDSGSLLFETRRGGKSQLQITTVSAFLSKWRQQLTPHWIKKALIDAGINQGFLGGKD
jgi:hypothetical protein